MPGVQASGSGDNGSHGLGLGPVRGPSPGGSAVGAPMTPVQAATQEPSTTKENRSSSIEVGSPLCFVARPAPIYESRRHRCSRSEQRDGPRGAEFDTIHEIVIHEIMVDGSRRRR